MFKKIYIEITNNCNLNCFFCNGTEREKEFLSMDKFKKLLDRLEGYTKYLYFHVMGEPLLHPDINSFIDIASERYFINITSNGYLIDKIKDNKNIRQLNLSLHSYNKSYRISLEDYMNNIFSSVDNLVGNDTIIKYRMWVDSDNKEAILDMLNKKYNVSIGDNKSIKLDNNIYYEVEEEFIWPNMSNTYYKEEGSCRGTRDHIGILVDGTVIPCCLDSNGIINLGNIYKSELNDIINGDLFKQIKEGFLCNKKVHELCRRCNFYDLRK